MAFLPDGDMLMTERPGRLRVVRRGRLLPEAVAGVPPVRAGGQGGRLDVAVHPRFAENRLIYLSYAHGHRTRVASALVPAASAVPSASEYIARSTTI